jgi:hypothetical protein
MIGYTENDTLKMMIESCSEPGRLKSLARQLCSLLRMHCRFAIAACAPLLVGVFCFGGSENKTKTGTV